MQPFVSPCDQEPPRVDAGADEDVIHSHRDDQNQSKSQPRLKGQAEPTKVPQPEMVRNHRISNILHKTLSQIKAPQGTLLFSEDGPTSTSLVESLEAIQQSDPYVLSPSGIGKYFAVSQNDTPISETHPELVSKLVHGLLRMGQLEKDLISYFNDFNQLINSMPMDNEILIICFRRFVNGLAEEQQRVFVREWLRIGGSSMQNIEDCLVVLSRWLKHIELPLMIENTPKVRTTRTENCDGSQESHTAGIVSLQLPRIPQQTRSANECLSKHPVTLCEIIGKPRALQKGTKRKASDLAPAPNVTTRAALATQKRLREASTVEPNNFKKGEEMQNDALSEVDQNREQPRPSDEALNEEKLVKIAQEKHVDTTPTKRIPREVGNTSRVRNIVPLRRRRSQSILAPQTPTKKPILPTSLRGKRMKRVNLPGPTNLEQLALSPTTTDQPTTPSTIRSSLRLSQARAKEVPKLVSLRKQKSVIIPETSDGVLLPSNLKLVRQEAPKKGRVECNVTPEIPTLRLTTSDLAA